MATDGGGAIDYFTVLSSSVMPFGTVAEHAGAGLWYIGRVTAFVGVFVDCVT